jgi:hypothetical protein
MNPTKAEPADHETAPSASRSSKVTWPSRHRFPDSSASPATDCLEGPRHVGTSWIFLHALRVRRPISTRSFVSDRRYRSGVGGLVGRSVSASPTSLRAIGCTSGDAIVAVPSCRVQPRDPARRRRGNGWHEPRSTRLVQMSPALPLARAPIVRPTPAVVYLVDRQRYAMAADVDEGP